MGFGKDGKGVILRQVVDAAALGTIDRGTTILLGTAPGILERFRIIKSEVYATVIGLTSGEGSGLFLGLADGDYAIAEVDAAIENTGPLGPNDAIAAELAERWTTILGATDGETGTERVFENKMGGHLMEETIRWTFARTKAWNFFVHNLGAQLTTGATVSIRAKHFGVWVL